MTEYSDTMGDLDARLVARILDKDPLLGEATPYYLAGGFWGVLIKEQDRDYMLTVYGEERDGAWLRACDSDTCSLMLTEWREDGEDAGTYVETVVAFEELPGAVLASMDDLAEQVIEWFIEDYPQLGANYLYLTDRISQSGTPTILHDHSRGEDCGDCEHWNIEQEEH